MFDEFDQRGHASTKKRRINIMFMRRFILIVLLVLLLCYDYDKKGTSIAYSRMRSVQFAIICSVCSRKACTS